jgi:hypothetical protein
LSQEVYRGFGPTLASEYLAKKHKLRIGREALRQLMIQAAVGCWKFKSRFHFPLRCNTKRIRV